MQWLNLFIMVSGFTGNISVRKAAPIGVQMNVWKILLVPQKSSLIIVEKIIAKNVTSKLNSNDIFRTIKMEYLSKIKNSNFFIKYSLTLPYHLSTMTGLNELSNPEIFLFFMVLVGTTRFLSPVPSRLFWIHFKMFDCHFFFDKHTDAFVLFFSPPFDIKNRTNL